MPPQCDIGKYYDPALSMCLSCQNICVDLAYKSQCDHFCPDYILVTRPSSTALAIHASENSNCLMNVRFLNLSFIFLTLLSILLITYWIICRRSNKRRNRNGLYGNLGNEKGHSIDGNLNKSNKNLDICTRKPILDETDYPLVRALFEVMMKFKPDFGESSSILSRDSSIGNTCTPTAATCLNNDTIHRQMVQELQQYLAEVLTKIDRKEKKQRYSHPRIPSFNQTDVLPKILKKDECNHIKTTVEGTANKSEEIQQSQTNKKYIHAKDGIKPEPMPKVNSNTQDGNLESDCLIPASTIKQKTGKSFAISSEIKNGFSIDLVSDDFYSDTLDGPGITALYNEAVQSLRANSEKFPEAQIVHVTIFDKGIDVFVRKLSEGFNRDAIKGIVVELTGLTTPEVRVRLDDPPCHKNK